MTHTFQTGPWCGIGIIHRGFQPDIFCDDFNRADNIGLGPLWDEGGAAAIKILSNQLAGDGSDLSAAFFTTALTDDHYAEWDVVLGTVHSFYVRCNNRLGPSVATFDCYEWFWQSSGGGTWTLRWYQNGSNMGTISTFTGHPTPLGTQMRFEIEGTTLRVKQDGVTIITTTDSTLSAGEFVGIRMDNPTVAVDNFCSGPL